MKTRSVKILGIGAVILMLSLTLIPMTAVAMHRKSRVIENIIVIRGNTKYVFTVYDNKSVFVEEYINVYGNVFGKPNGGQYKYVLVRSGWIYPNAYPFKPYDDFFGLPPHTANPLS